MPATVAGVQGAHTSDEGRLPATPLLAKSCLFADLEDVRDLKEIVDVRRDAKADPKPGARKARNGRGPKRIGAGLAATAVALLCAGQVLADPIPYTKLQDADDAAASADPTLPTAQIPPSGDQAGPDLGPLPGETPPPVLAPQSPAAQLREGLRAAKLGESSAALGISARLTDPLARKLITWALIDNAATRLDFSSLDAALHELDGWPRAWRRQAGAEKTIEAASLSPQKVVDWFAGRDPDTPEGAMALANAYQNLGRLDETKELIRHYWREHIFELDQQNRMLARFGVYLDKPDHEARLETLLYAQQGPATRAMMDMVDADHRLLAEARIAFRALRSDAPDLAAKVPHDLQTDPGLAFDRARYYRKKNLAAVAAEELPNFPTYTPDKNDVQGFIWNERRALMLALIRAGDTEGAFNAATDTGLKSGPELAEAEFYAGWIALRRMNDPVLADRHFEGLQAAAQSSITIARAYYWRARAAEARGDGPAAAGFYKKGAVYYTTFYGLLCAEASGQTQLVIGHDPEPTPEERRAYDGKDFISAAKRLAEIGDREDFRAFVLAAAEGLTSPGELALLVDMARQNADQELALRLARRGSVHGVFLPERGYPLREPPQPPGAAEPAFMLAITRQESSFEPRARSAVGARGMMQLMPATAQGLARRMGVHYAPALLEEADYNMRLGGVFLGSLVNHFSGSYVMAAAAYNAGPGRPADWINGCGDPRKSTADPLDFIECIPFAETRDYVMRVMENTAVYRARLNGGSAPLTIAEDLKRGRWNAPPPTIDSLIESLGAGR